MKRSETTEQIALFNWAKRTESILPELALMYHVPNEGKRSNGGILKAAGLKSGVPDICLPVANNGFHGLYIELKFGKNKATKAQEEYMAMLNAQGYKTAVCYGAEKPVAEDVVNLLIATVDAIEDKHMKGITVDVGHGVKAKVSKMAKESIKVERSENKKTTYEE